MAQKSGVYIHIPFCRRRCNYCDFYTAGGHGTVPKKYVEALIKAYNQYKEKLSPGTLQSVYFGGGTPGLLAPAQVERLLTAINPPHHAEITLEVNPGAATDAKLKDFRKAGINRLSVGVQTADDSQLKQLGRTHTTKDAATMLQRAAGAGFENISGDIMLALPRYTKQIFDDTLAFISKGGATHISAYLLSIEEGTPFGKSPPPQLPTDEQTADFYLYAVHRLEETGYRQYEISNFAKPGFEGRHNLLYWNCDDYLALGPSAHSSLGGVRYAYPNDAAAFMRGAAMQKEQRCDADDYIMLRLRLNEGLSQSRLEERFGYRFSRRQLRFLKQLESQRLLCLEGDVIRLLPQGMLVQNSILTGLL